MSGCSICGDSSSLLYDCNYCTGKYCKSHRLPENHNCPGLKQADTHGPEFRSSGSGGLLGEAFGSETDPPKQNEETADSDTDTADPGAELPGAAKDYTTSSSPDVNPDGSIARPDDEDAENDSQRSITTQGRRVAATIAGLAIIAILAPFQVVKRLPSYLRRFNRWLSRLLGSIFSLVKTVTPILLLAVGALFLAGFLGTGVPAIDENAEAGAGAVAGMLDTDTESEEEAIETAIHSEVNEIRSERGLATLENNPALHGVAKNHSQDMVARDFYAHENPDGEDSYDRVTSVGITCNAVGENLYYSEGYGTSPNTTAERVVESWLASSGHRRNLLSDAWNSEGIGVEIRGDELWVTQVFCG
ncbi:hypothetical protein HWV23_02660 [Natronomonas halophila]|uniref:CAP domain-containing protein n=1 Tax=Natronomonas halophila TaxID=2747817 RepID=UPI0015B7885C|nr:CAP domain-containing protein [Natronomonas halophila]QLD84601.1 hypothetical protein HWV23_02375 [Natronomonas halophila]QLD84657.1 hypothetical protein HWV23_02660 [Natronomonas halophila]